MRTRGRFLPLLVVLTAVAVIAGGCSDDGDPPDQGGASSANDPVADLPAVPDSDYVDMTGQAEVTIEAKDNKFEPQFVIVSPGTTITFENKGRNPHNVIPVDESQFDAVPTDEFQPDDVATLSFSDPGNYPYYCSLHGTPSAGMDGRIRVADA